MRGLAAIVVVLIACGDRDTPKQDAPAAGDAPVTDGAAADSSTMVDASTTPTIGPRCGATTCTGGQGCCIGSTSVCRDENSCPTQWFACDGAEDCAGGKCCFGSGGQGGSSCVAAGANCADVACHADGECPSAAPKCCPRPFTAYKQCQASCT